MNTYHYVISRLYDNDHLVKYHGYVFAENEDDAKSKVQDHYSPNPGHCSTTIVVSPTDIIALGLLR